MFNSDDPIYTTERTPLVAANDTVSVQRYQLSSTLADTAIALRHGDGTGATDNKELRHYRDYVEYHRKASIFPAFSTVVPLKTLGQLTFTIGAHGLKCDSRVGSKGLKLIAAAMLNDDAIYTALEAILLVPSRSFVRTQGKRRYYEFALERGMQRWQQLLKDPYAQQALYDYFITVNPTIFDATKDGNRQHSPEHTVQLGIEVIIALGVRQR